MLAACSGEKEAEAPEQTAEEMRISAEKERLAGAKKALQDAGISGINVVMAGDRATISGSDVSKADQERASELVKNVLGINWVDDEFGPSEAELAAQRAEEERVRVAMAEAQAKKDAELTKTAKAKIEELGFINISVSVDNSVATVSGRSAGAIEDSDIITALGKIYGVRSVKSELTDIRGNVISDERRRQARDCADSIFAALDEDTIQFKSGSTKLTDASLTIVDNIAEAMNKCTGGLLAIYGHTDSSGAADANQRVSLARAEAVASALEERGVKRANIGTEGFGEARPIADNNTAGGRAANRRIEFKFSL
jgi:outer membrane protein OmpA-like peptidoglycan-associated protein